MKITEVELFPIMHQLSSPFGNGQGWTSSRQYLIVRLRADDGSVGYGECWGPIAGNEQIVRNILAPMLIGADPMKIGVLWEEMRHKLLWAFHSFLPYSALSGVDIALWDLKGRILGLPVHNLLGGSFHTTIPAYATGHYFRQVDTMKELVAEILREAANNRERGFARLKLKIGLATMGWGVEQDIELMRAVRYENADAGLAIDANCAYSVPQALQVGKAAQDLGMLWFEEPLPPSDKQGYERLSQRLDVPVAAGESWASLPTFLDVFNRGCVSIAQPDVCSAGGISEVRRIAEAARGLNLACYPHVWGTPIAIAASLQVLATVPGPVLLEYDQSPNAIREQLAEEPFVLNADGGVRVPDAPGLGLDINEDALHRFSIEA